MAALCAAILFWIYTKLVKVFKTKNGYAISSFGINGVKATFVNFVNENLTFQKRGIAKL